MKPDQPANIVDDQGGEPVGSREVIRIHKHTFHIISSHDGAGIVSKKFQYNFSLAKNGNSDRLKKFLSCR